MLSGPLFALNRGDVTAAKTEAPYGTSVSLGH